MSVYGGVFRNDGGVVQIIETRISLRVTICATHTWSIEDRLSLLVYKRDASNRKD